MNVPSCLVVTEGYYSGILPPRTLREEPFFLPLATSCDYWKIGLSAETPLWAVPQGLGPSEAADAEPTAAPPWGQTAIRKVSPLLPGTVGLQRTVSAELCWMFGLKWDFPLEVFLIS